MILFNWWFKGYKNIEKLPFNFKSHKKPARKRLLIIYVKHQIPPIYCFKVSIGAIRLSSNYPTIGRLSISALSAEQSFNF